MNQTQNRDALIVRTSVVGILTNLFLAAFKAAIGIFSNSIAVTLDAVNNLSDAGSSIITIVGTKLAAKPADRQHPFGYGRIEYLTAAIIAVIVLYAGITSLSESIQKIIHPETPSYSMLALTIITVGVLVKYGLGKYVKKNGQMVHSDSLINSGQDALLDAVISASTLAAAVIFILFHVSLEAYLGAVISVFIIKSGLEMLRDTLSQILGQRADPSLIVKIKKITDSFPEVHGTYDVVLQDYGPDYYTGSLHIEVDDTLTACDIDRLNKQITYRVYEELNIILTAISVYAVNTQDETIITMRKTIADIAFRHENILQMHGFYVDQSEKVIRFDLVISFDEPDRMALCQTIRSEVQKAYPDYKIYIVVDNDISELIQKDA